MHGAGVLITGDAATGKSELALALIDRGHALVADDATDLRRTQRGLVGRAPPLLAGLLRLRGLGVVDVRNTYGRHTYRAESVIDLVLNLTREAAPEDALLGGAHTVCMLDQDLPAWRIPVDRAPPSPLLVEATVRLWQQRRGSTGAPAAEAMAWN